VYGGFNVVFPHDIDPGDVFPGIFSVRSPGDLTDIPSAIE